MQVNYSQKPDKKIKISGTVLDANKKPVPNVMIFVDKVKTNSVTDSKGFYRVKVSPTAKSIVAFSLYNGVKEMEIDGKNVVNFNLDRAGKKPSQPVKAESDMINVGYGQTDKKDLTIPVNKIEGNKSKYAGYNTVYEMISGEVPGVVVNGTSINVQNSFSFKLSTEPLFVVDGTIVNDIKDIIPAQVKSIVVLKGASASIYGARGANGVIVITLLGGNDNN